MLPNQTLSLSLAAATAILSPLHVLGASMLQRESIGTDKPPPLVATNLQRPSAEHVSVWQAQFMKRMENVNPSAMLALNPNVLSRPVPPSQAESENQGVPGVNLPCGWLEGYENPEGEEGVNSANFRLGPGRYTLHIRWTRMPQIGDCQASAPQPSCA